MSIKDFTDKIKSLYIPLCIVCICIISFALGRLSNENINKSPIQVLRRIQEEENTIQSDIKTEENTQTILGLQSSGVVASKTGSKYYFPWCGALKRIKPENRIEFASVSMARQAGYAPASNCKGVK